MYSTIKKWNYSSYVIGRIVFEEKREILAKNIFKLYWMENFFTNKGHSLWNNVE
jgi:hypothetical protein